MRRACLGLLETLSDALFNKLLLVPIELVDSEPGDLLTISVLDSAPEELDAVEIWSIGCVPDHLDLQVWCHFLCWLLVNAGVVHKDGELLVLTHSDS